MWTRNKPKDALDVPQSEHRAEVDAIASPENAENYRRKLRFAIQRRNAEAALRSLQTSVFMQLERERAALTDIDRYNAEADRDGAEEAAADMAKTLLRGVDRMTWATC